MINPVLQVIRDMNGINLIFLIIISVVLIILGIMAYSSNERGYRIGFLDGYLNRKKDDSKEEIEDSLPFLSDDWEEWKELPNNEGVPEEISLDDTKEDTSKVELDKRLISDSDLSEFFQEQEKKEENLIVRKKIIAKTFKRTISDSIMQKIMSSKQHSQLSQV